MLLFSLNYYQYTNQEIKQLLLLFQFCYSGNSIVSDEIHMAVSHIFSPQIQGNKKTVFTNMILENNFQSCTSRPYC